MSTRKQRNIDALAKATETVVAPDPPPGVDIWTPISGIVELPDGTILVHTNTTSEAPDSEREIADYEPMKAAITDFMASGANLREMHDSKASGTVLKATFDDDARKIEADLHVVDPVAITKVKTNTYKGVSWGGAKWVGPWVDTATGKVRHIVKAVINELSLCDRPANPDALLAKADREMYVLAKRKESTVADTTTAVAEAAQTYTGAKGTPLAPEQQEPVVAKKLSKAAFPGAAPPFGKACADGKCGKCNKCTKAATKLAKRQIRTAKLQKKAAALTKKKFRPADAHAAIDTVGTAHSDVADVLGEAHDAVDAAANPPDDDGDDADKLAKKAERKAVKSQRSALRKSARTARKTIKLAKMAQTIRRAAKVAVKPLAKVGARNSSADAGIIDSIHDSAVALGSQKCLAKQATGTPLDPSIAAPIVVNPESMAKSEETAFDALISRIRSDIGGPLAKQLDSAKVEILSDLGARLAKVEKMPAGGGPLSAPSRGGANDASVEEKILAKAAERFPVGSAEREALGKISAQEGIAALMR